MKSIDLMYQTMLAELGQRSLDAAWTADFPPGSCVDAPGLGKKIFQTAVSERGILSVVCQAS